MNRRSFNSLWMNAAASAAIAIVCLSGCSSRRMAGPGVVDPDAPEEYTTTETGVQYRIRRRGDGELPLLTDSVRVHYRGWYIDEAGNEKTFDQSYNRPMPVEFRLKQLVPGFSEAMLKVREGGMIEMIIPPELGYGSEGNAAIPPDTTLHFRVELDRIL